MCQECVKNSQEELEGHILAKIGLEVCYTCIATVRRSLALKPILDKAAREAIEHVREKIEVRLYSVMQKNT